MTKIQADFYTQWKRSLIDVSLSAAATLTAVQENVELDSTGAVGAFTVTLPDITFMTTNKRIWFYDNGNAGTNNITIVANGGDGSAVDNASSFIVDRDNMIVKAELINTRWMFAVTDAGQFNLGSLYMSENPIFTTINTVNTYTDIGGTATAGVLDNNFTLTNSPNVLTYDGDNTIKVLLNASLSLSKQLQPFDNMRAAIFLNGSEILGASGGISINRRSESMSIVVPSQLITNDAIKVMVKNINTTNNILVEDLNLTIHEL